MERKILKALLAERFENFVENYSRKIGVDAKEFRLFLVKFLQEVIEEISK